jgi:flagellar protein FlaI
VLENRVAADHGYVNKKDIYKDLKKRERILQKMVELNITGYKEVVKILGDFYEKGPESLPFTY